MFKLFSEKVTPETYFLYSDANMILFGQMSMKGRVIAITNIQDLRTDIPDSWFKFSNDYLRIALSELRFTGFKDYNVESANVVPEAFSQLSAAKSAKDFLALYEAYRDGIGSLKYERGQTKSSVHTDHKIPKAIIGHDFSKSDKKYSIGCSALINLDYSKGKSCWNIPSMVLPGFVLNAIKATKHGDSFDKIFDHTLQIPESEMVETTIKVEGDTRLVFPSVKSPLLNSVRMFIESSEAFAFNGPVTYKGLNLSVCDNAAIRDSEVLNSLINFKADNTEFEVSFEYAGFVFSFKDCVLKNQSIASNTIDMALEYKHFTVFFKNIGNHAQV